MTWHSSIIFFLIALLLSACGVGGTSNRAQTERVRGSWAFSHPSASPSTMSVNLVGELEAFPDEPGTFYTYGLTNRGMRSLAWYDVEREVYVLGYSDGNKDHIYLFNFFESDKVDGCYIQVLGETSSGCMYAEGARSAAEGLFVATQAPASSDAASILKTYREIRTK